MLCRSPSVTLPVLLALERLRGWVRVFAAGERNTAKFTNGTITGYRAGPGWDPVTGWGSPNAHVVVPLLNSYTSR
jgi:hypothetical protein